MRQAILFLLMIATIMVSGQEPEGRLKSSLIISEIRSIGYSPTKVYYEFSNVGDTAIQMSHFKFGKLRSNFGVPYVWDDNYWGRSDIYLFFPERILQPGETFMITDAYDFTYKQHALRVPGWEGNEMGHGERKMNEMADILIHRAEYLGDETDSITPIDAYNGIIHSNFVSTMNRGMAAVFLEQHLPNGDSVVVDQVFGTFHLTEGQNPREPDDVLPIAGMEGAAATATLFRKYSVKEGNLDFFNARGLAIDDSEWIPVVNPPFNTVRFREPWWTIQNHGPYVLDDNTLEPQADDITVDYAGKTITVPWGIRRLDDIMLNMKKKPGVAWYYDLNENYADSLYRSAQTGDKLTIYVIGTGLMQATFDILVREPLAADNTVIPIDHKRTVPGSVTNNTQQGQLAWPRVTRHASGIDTITGNRYGLPTELRVDSLFKYLEKPVNATWEIVWGDGVARPDLKEGDKLRVVAENGDVKEYAMVFRPLEKSTNAFLASITWPDIPDYYKGFFGWQGDTIPGFSSGNYSYRLEVPIDVEGIPALVTKAQNVNAKVTVHRARSLTGTVEDRTITFEVAAEDEVTKNTYSVELVKEIDPRKLQPFHGEPFFSEQIYQGQNRNGYLEIFNPGNQMLDLSNYLIVITRSGGESTPEDAIRKRTSTSDTDYLRRFEKYVPGYRYVDRMIWQSGSPGTIVPDPNVNPMVQPGGTFVMTQITALRQLRDYIDQWSAAKITNVNFHNFRDGDFAVLTPWGEDVELDPNLSRGNPVGGFRSSHYYLFKIKNDSVRQSLKPIKDPDDFELIDSWGNTTYSTWVIGGRTFSGQGHSFIRKPHIWKGNPVLGASFGTDMEDSEWLWRGKEYNEDSLGLSTVMAWLYATMDIGKHFFIEPTHYKSTVSSLFYKVSEGYSLDEEIMGVTTGTTVGDFLNNLIKADDNQLLTVKSAADGSELTQDALLQMNDILEVVSADSVNTSRYKLEVTEEGLSSDAVLTSTRYNVTVESDPKSAGASEEPGFGYVSGFVYGTQLRTVLNNVNLPGGASMSVINSSGAYVPLKTLNFDTIYVEVAVHSDIYLEVTAEDGKTKISYQLRPETSADDAFVLSDAYTVQQLANLITLVPRGTTIQTFMSYLTPSFGATVKLVDKMGFEKSQGSLREDDKLVVTSSNELVTRVYHVSFLATATIPETTYLAYVLSEAYAVDQVNYVITAGLAPLSGSTLLSEFHSYINPCIGATAVVVDKDGNEKSAGDLDDGDRLKVISADGKIVVYYSLDLDLTFANDVVSTNVEIYPNPTSGRLTVSGLDAGNRLQVFNASGALVLDKTAQSNLEVISLDEHPSGLYLIVISDNNQMLGRYKAIRK